MPMLVDSPILIAPNLDKKVYLLGLDFGSTTSSALIASAHISRSAMGRMQFSDMHIVFRSAPALTPFENGMLDLANIEKMLHGWLTASNISVHQLFSGGSIITGLAAQSHNVDGLQGLIKAMVGDSVIATADDPCLESWLAFMGSCAGLSRYHADRLLLNLDIGGGTTNAALGLNGDVQTTGSYFIGARHFQFVPNRYQLLAITHYG